MILKAEAAALGTRLQEEEEGNGSGRGPTPPDIEEIIKNIQRTN